MSKELGPLQKRNDAFFEFIEDKYGLNKFLSLLGTNKSRLAAFLMTVVSIQNSPSLIDIISSHTGGMLDSPQWKVISTLWIKRVLATQRIKDLMQGIWK